MREGYLIDEEDFRLEAENINLRLLLAKAGFDAAEHAKAERLHRILLEELHHRLKNNLAVVAAITTQSLRTAASLEDAKVTIGERLAALGRVHDLLLRTGWANATIDLILRTATQPFGMRRFAIESAVVMVGSQAAQSLTLILHELATNAVKHGALSNAEGRVTITATVDAPSERLGIIWRETDGPQVREPLRRGLGTRLIVDSLPAQFGATTRLTFPPSGVVFELDLPVASLRAD